METNIKNQVFWYKQAKPSLPALQKDMVADVAIVGGGMAGLMAAQYLQEHGKSVVVLERDFCGAGASGRTSGFITPDSEIELGSLLSAYGDKKAKKIWEFVLAGVESIRRNIVDYQIECDYQVQDSLFIANTNHAVKFPKHEYNARTTLNYASRYYKQSELPRIIGSKKYTGAVRYPDTFGINSYDYCQGLKSLLLKQGVKIFEATPALSVNSWGVQTPKSTVKAKHIIVATDRFIPELGKLQNEIYHVQTFLAVTKPLRQADAKLIFPEQKMMVWDTDLVYNYFRVTGDNRLLLGGGDVFYTYARQYATSTKRFARRLRNYFHGKFPGIKIEIDYLWPGMLGVSKDLLPIMGPDEQSPNIWYVGAATGLPWAAALGLYAAERLVNQRKDFDQIFSPHRHFLIHPWLQKVIGNPPTYAISHGLAKYFE